MSRILGAVCALVCALTLGSAFTPAASADPGHPVRILVFGDSLTLSRHGMYTWRYRLDKEFHRQGVPFDFVGSLSSPYVDKGYPAPRYLDPDFDQDHFCKSGWWLRDAIHGSLGAEVARQDPDVVVLELGGADVTYGDSAEVTSQRMRAALAEIRAAKPTVRIILPEVLTRDRPDPSINVRTRAFDSKLADLAAELSTDESPITVADVTAGWTPNATYTMDGSHLSPTGEAFYAQRIAEELHRVGILPLAPDVFHGYIPWTRTVPPRLVVTPGRVSVSWSRETVSSARARWRRVGSSRWRTSALYPNGRLAIPLPAGGSYEVQLQITWYLLTGPWGTTSRVHVPRAVRPVAPARVTVTRGGVRWAASRGAASYVVRLRKLHQRRWLVRRTTSTHVASARVAVARVRAVGPGGTSAWRSDNR